jgi:hypothetical protein
MPFYQRVFAHATETTGSGSFPQRGAGFLLLLFFDGFVKSIIVYLIEKIKHFEKKCLTRKGLFDND